MSSETTNTETKPSEANESTEVEGASVSDTSSLSVEHVEDTSVSNSEADPTHDEEDSETSEIEEIHVEDIMVDEYPIGPRVIDQPLSEPIVAALQSMGVNYLTRYQQALLDYMMQGEDWWLAANLSSSRGMTIGSYLVDVALGNPDDLSVIVCVAVPKVREFFTKDLLSVAQYTELKILMLDAAIAPDVTLDETPNILVAPVDVVLGLTERVDMTHIQVLYLDEMEKSLRDCGDLVQQLCSQFESAQRIVQTSYFSASLNPQVESVVPGIVPHRFRKTFNKKEWSIYNSEQSWIEISRSLLANNLFSRYLVVVESEEIHQMVSDGVSLGLDVAHSTGDTDVVLCSKMFDRLKDNRIQVLFVTPDVLELSNPEHFETDFLVVSAAAATKHWGVLNGFRKQVRSLVLIECTDEEWEGHPILPILTLCPHEQSMAESVLQSVRTQSMEYPQEIWSDSVDSLLNSPDRNELIGMLIQTFLQRSRGELGYIYSSVYKMETRDIYQRRKKSPRVKRHTKRKS